MSVEAARLKRARRRMRIYFFGSGVIMAFLFISLAALIASMIGVGKTSYIVTLLMAAGVMAGGTYGVIFLGSVAMHVIRRVWNRKPIMEREE